MMSFAASFLATQVSYKHEFAWGVDEEPPYL
jgi:hypothetical protein